MEMAAGKTKNKMTSITFYGGADEISGNKILLENKDARIYFALGIFGSGLTKGVSFSVQPLWHS